MTLDYYNEGGKYPAVIVLMPAEYLYSMLKNKLRNSIVYTQQFRARIRND
jgi:hypothetical protein